MIDLKKSPDTVKLPPNPLRTLYRRRCSVTGEGMNSGWVFGDGAFYIKYDRDVLAELRKDRAHILHDIEDVKIDMVQDPERFVEFEQARDRALLSKDTDEDLRTLAYQTDYGYYTEWDEEIGPDDECYTLHGVELHTEADRLAYRNNLPCSDVERAAVVLAQDGHHVWVIEGEGEEYGDPRLWTGKQFLCIGNIWNLTMDDSIAVEVGKRELKHYSDRYLADPYKFLGTAMNPNRWRFIGWESIHKTLPELMPKEYGNEDIPFS